MTLTRADGTVTASGYAVAGATKYHVTYTSDGGQSWGAAAVPNDNYASDSVTFNADNAKSYVVGVRAGNTHGWSGWRNSPSVGPYTPDETPTPPPPAAPSSVTLTRADGTVTASGYAVAGADQYHITYTSDGGQSWGAAAVPNDNFAGSSVTFNADNAKSYVVGVRAGNATGWSGWRNSPSIGPYTPPPPAAPAGLRAMGDDQSVTLSWDDPSNSSITGYEYQTRQAGVAWSAWTAMANSDADTTSHTVTGLDNGTEYRFKLRAVNAGGKSGAAPTASPWYVAATPEQMAFGQQQQGVSLAASNVTYSTATLTLIGHTGNWWYKQTAPSSGSCSPGNTTTATVKLKRLSPGVSYTYKAYSDATCATEVTSDATDADFAASSVVLSTIWHIIPEGESVPHTVWLSHQPSANVTVTVATSGDTDITASPATLTFTPSNWATPQTVTVSAAQDTDTVPGTGKGDGAYAYGATDVTHTAASGDASFNNVSVVLKATEGDDDVCSGTTAVGGSGVTSGALVEDCDTLLAAKDIINGSRTEVNNWDTGLALNSWTGITVANSRVTELNLSFFLYAGGNGNLPNTIADLSALTLLVMESGGAATLPGPIPPNLASLTGLTRLTLYQRELTGELPANIGDLTALTILELDTNQLSGRLPASLGNLTGLTKLWLSGNRFSGRIPPQLDGITSPTTDDFSLNGNRLGSCVPLGWTKYLSKINPQKDANGNDVNLPLCPGQVAQPTVVQQHEGAAVSWSAPAVGVATRYQIRWRPCLVTQPREHECVSRRYLNGPEDPAWAPWRQVTYLDGLKSGLDTVLGGDTTSYTINGLRNGVRYQVKVRPGHTLPGRFGETTYGPWSDTSDDVWPNEVAPYLLARYRDISHTAAKLTIVNHTGPWWYQQTAPSTGNCVSVSSGNTADLSTLAAGSSYTYRAYSATGCGSGDQIASTTFATQNLTAGSVTATTATLAIANHHSQWWYEQVAPSSGSCTDAFTGTTADLSNLTAGASHTYLAYNKSGCNSADEIASATFTTLAITLAASSVTANTATLTLANGPVNWWLKETSPNTGTCTPKTTATESLSSLTAGTSYTYKAYSDSACATANEIASETFTTPASLTASAITTTGATLTAAGAPSTWYIQRTAPTAGTCTTKTSTTHDPGTLTAGTTYTYKAYDAAGCNSADEIASETFTTLQDGNGEQP